MPDKSVTHRPLACRLNGDDNRNRLTWIENLTRRALRGHRRDNLTLHLTDVPEALADVPLDGCARTGMLRVSDFRPATETHAINVTITAPEAVRDSADMLFA